MVSLTPKGEKLKTTMNIVLIIHGVVALFKMFLMSPLSCIGDVISCLVLYCGVTQHNFCNILMYMVFCLFDAFGLFTALGYMIQVGYFSGDNSGSVKSGFVFGLSALMFIFYSAAVYFSFQTYKEFKAIYQE